MNASVEEGLTYNTPLSETSPINLESSVSQGLLTPLGDHQNQNSTHNVETQVNLITLSIHSRLGL